MKLDPRREKLIVRDGKEYVLTTNHDDDPYSRSYWNFRSYYVPVEEFDDHRRKIKQMTY